MTEFENANGGVLSLEKDHVRTAIIGELSTLVDEGLLEWSINDDGEAVYWPTAEGARVLGMTL